MSPKQLLDHLILFVPANSETKLPQLPSFIENHFTLTPGGFHADGATSNTLILLADGCYIELISFIDISQSSSHWWGPEGDFVGWKDWCLTNSTSPEENYKSVSEFHAQPVHGGRKRADGVEVKWAVTFPKGEKGGQEVRGRIPFFCHDITSRNIRVPLSAESTTHPCGALGVQQVTIIVKDKTLLDETRRVYTAILGNDGVMRGDEVHFQADRVCNAEGLAARPRIVLRLPGDKTEFDATMKTGFYYGNVLLAAPAGGSKQRGTKERLDSSDQDVRGLWLEYI